MDPLGTPTRAWTPSRIYCSNSSDPTTVGGGSKEEFFHRFPPFWKDHLISSRSGGDEEDVTGLWVRKVSLPPPFALQSHAATSPRLVLEKAASRVLAHLTSHVSSHLAPCGWGGGRNNAWSSSVDSDSGRSPPVSDSDFGPTVGSLVSASVDYVWWEEPAGPNRSYSKVSEGVWGNWDGSLEEMAPSFVCDNTERFGTNVFQKVYSILNGSGINEAEGSFLS